MKSAFQNLASKRLHFKNGRLVRSTLSILTLVGLAIPAVDVPIAHAESNRAQCKGKLGVHRTIKVSKKNALLVGVDNHARLGLKPKELILTFDDGPRPITTPKILEALKAECIKATFFSLGRAARANPQLLRQTARGGHTIATHTQSHPLLTKRNSDSVRAEVRRGVNSINVALEGSGYKASNFFRYPFLGRSKRTDAIVKEMGLVAFHMNIDSWDWRQQTPEEMVALTMRRVRAEGSGVVLFHDIQDRTAAGLPLFLETIKAEGYKIVHIVQGDSDFDYRKDLAEQRVASAASKKKAGGTKVAALSKPNATSASKNSSVQRIGSKKKKSERRSNIRLAKVPLPKRRPRLPDNKRETASALGLRESLGATNEDDRLINQVTNSTRRAQTPRTEVATLPKQKKKRFRIFRRLFGNEN